MSELGDKLEALALEARARQREFHIAVALLW
jgi:hypothetical protein